MERDKYWDSLKFVLIFLVVYGHIVAHYLGKSHFNMAIFNLIYLFHIPLFIFISGRFSHVKDIKKYKKGIVRLVETYVVFQIIRTIASVLFEKAVLSWDCLIIPNWILWYHVALIYWRLMVYFIYLKAGQQWIQQHRLMIVLASFAISIMAGFIPVGDAFSLQRALSFLPFFVMGYYSVDFDIRDKCKKIPVTISLLIFIVIFGILYRLHMNLDYVHHCSFPYWAEDNAHTLLRLGLRCLFLIIAIVLGAFVMGLVPSNKVLAKWGSTTMFIYIYHSFALREVLFLSTTGNATLQHPIMLLVHAVIVTTCLIILSRSKFLNMLMNPISKNVSFQ
jgi:fucose 4-O-acetylase-like acetyltransferase